MKKENAASVQLENTLEEIKSFLSSLQGEVMLLETSYSEVLSVLQNLEQRLETTADQDDLTGLLRRKPFFRKWRALLERCESLGRTCSILMLDIDHFKKINDTYGHAAGDEVIRRVSGLLKAFSSPTCIAGRFGGEEFILATTGTPEEVTAVGEEIRRAVETAPCPDGIQCTVSIGIATEVEAADQALYQAKQSGRNRVAVKAA